LKNTELSGKQKAGQRRILIVDDDTEFRNTLRALVESLGYLSTETDSAHAALALMEKRHFPIVISDIVMPEKDGLKLLQVIKERYPEVDVLIITGFESEYSPLEIVQAGASDFLAKPFGMDQLGARLHKIEREKALREKLYLSAIADPLTGVFNRRYFFHK
jgi:DNA-binding NtrC family response regulator